MFLLQRCSTIFSKTMVKVLKKKMETVPEGRKLINKQTNKREMN